MSSNSFSSSVSLHLSFFLVTLLSFLGFTWYINYESIMGWFFDQIRLALIISPLLILAAVQLLSFLDRPFFNLMPRPEIDSFQHAGGTPWGVGLLLVLLLFMISYQANFRERWFPLLA